MQSRLPKSSSKISYKDALCAPAAASPCSKSHSPASKNDNAKPRQRTPTGIEQGDHGAPPGKLNRHNPAPLYMPARYHQRQHPYHYNRHSQLSQHLYSQQHTSNSAMAISSVKTALPASKHFSHIAKLQHKHSPLDRDLHDGRLLNLHVTYPDDNQLAKIKSLFPHVIDASVERPNPPSGIWNNCLIGQLVEGGIPVLMLEKAVKDLWSLHEGMQLRQLAVNLFAFFFDDDLELIRIIMGGPWRIDDNILMLQRFTSGINPARHLVASSPVWINLWAIPLELQNKRCLLNIIEQFGSPITIEGDFEDASHINEDLACIRACVDVNFLEPLKPGIFVKLVDREHWIIADYEDSLGICFQCGRQGHTFGDCPFTNLKLHSEAEEELMKKIYSEHALKKSNKICRNRFKAPSPPADSSDSEAAQEELLLNDESIREDKKDGLAYYLWFHITKPFRTWKNLKHRIDGNKCSMDVEPLPSSSTPAPMEADNPPPSAPSIFQFTALTNNIPSDRTPRLLQFMPPSSKFTPPTPPPAPSNLSAPPSVTKSLQSIGSPRPIDSIPDYLVQEQRPNAVYNIGSSSVRACGPPRHPSSFPGKSSARPIRPRPYIPNRHRGRPPIVFTDPRPQAEVNKAGHATGKFMCIHPALQKNYNISFDTQMGRPHMPNLSALVSSPVRPPLTNPHPTPNTATQPPPHQFIDLTDTSETHLHISSLTSQ